MATHDGHRQRLKDRFILEGLDNFNEVQVLELLLFYVIPRQDTNPLAHRLLDRFGSLYGVLCAPVEELRHLAQANVSMDIDTFTNLNPRVLQVGGGCPSGGVGEP